MKLSGSSVERFALLPFSIEFGGLCRLKSGPKRRKMILSRISFYYSSIAMVTILRKERIFLISNIEAVPMEMTIAPIFKRLQIVLDMRYI